VDPNQVEEKVFGNFFGGSRIPAKQAQNHRKPVKMQNNFFGFLVSLSSTFVKHDHTFEL
jgi:hypothetical protein